jgi:serine-type D-Ala-D-Ala carboxypeptidase/endopeptidase
VRVAAGDIERILSNRRSGVYTVVGMIDARRRQIVSTGLHTGDTIFEIGSVTKVLTSLLLADMVERGEAALSDPVIKYLPAGVRTPMRDEPCIELEHLATHTSGLPRLPGNLRPKDRRNPYAEYTTDRLYEFLSQHVRRGNIGSCYRYSNLGAGLLGHLLSLRAGVSYEALIRDRLTGPLEMKSTGITLAPEMESRFPIGHSARLKPVPHWDMAALEGAGALRSSANDLLSLLAAHLGFKPSPLAAAIRRALSVRHPTGVANREVALGWHILKRPEGEIVWHNGATGGFRSFAGFAPATGLGVAVLSNASASVDGLGFHLLDPRLPVSRPRPVSRLAHAVYSFFTAPR